MCTQWDNDEVVQRFRDYLRIASVQPDVDYGECVNFLKKQAAELDLPVVVYELVPKKPIVVITWEGSEPMQQSILLNSHMDVVPVNEEHWSYPPFEATIADDGCIYARGTQDMKSVGMMHIEAVRRLKDAGIRLKRTIHISFVPDEEIGSTDGMRVFAASEEFKKLNVGFEMDESGPSKWPNQLYMFYGERTLRQITVTCKAAPGHGSLIVAGPELTAGEKLLNILEKFMSFRAQEKQKVEKGAWFGDVTTVNLTQIEGGVQVNVLPESLSLTFDIRIATDVDLDEFENMISRWCKESGPHVTYEYIAKNPKIESTKINNLKYWDTMKKAANNMGIEVIPVICPGTTDARFIREQGIPAINFTPILSTPLLVHGNDESIHVDMYKKGIEIMTNVVEGVANA